MLMSTRFMRRFQRSTSSLPPDTPLGHPAEVIFQGPIADALTHVGQLAIIRRLAGAPVRPESYGRAKIETGRVGRDQATERREVRWRRKCAGVEWRLMEPLEIHSTVNARYISTPRRSI